MFLVADTGPLNYLIGIGLAELLYNLYGKVVVPTEVLNELLVADAPQVVRA